MNKKLWVVGIGPGDPADLTSRAKQVLSECDCIVGYDLYCDLIRPYFADKEFISTPMRGEEERVKIALKKADAGTRTALICSGDAGVYGLAGLAISYAEGFPEVETEVIPGVTAATSGAAILGAPLVHDFSVISLSDRLTPMDLIEKRLRAAAMADMVIVLYNPSSKSRPEHLKHACEVLEEVIPPERICAVAKNIGRENETKEIMTLSELKDADTGMFATVFIGNSATRKMRDFMVTPRGYESER